MQSLTSDISLPFADDFEPFMPGAWIDSVHPPLPRSSESPDIAMPESQQAIQPEESPSVSEIPPESQPDSPDVTQLEESPVASDESPPDSTQCEGPQAPVASGSPPVIKPPKVSLAERVTHLADEASSNYQALQAMLAGLMADIPKDEAGTKVKSIIAYLYLLLTHYNIGYTS